MTRCSLHVVAAVIQCDGRILIGQRPRSHSHGLKWEFPGGKVQRGETPQAALARELEEELGIQAQIGPALLKQTFQYPGRVTISLAIYRVTVFNGTPENLAFEHIVWETPDRLLSYDFLDSDKQLVRRLAAGEFLSDELNWPADEHRHEGTTRRLA